MTDVKSINRYQTFFHLTKKIILAYQEAVLDREKMGYEPDFIRNHLAERFVTKLEKLTLAFMKTGCLTATVMSVDNGIQTDSKVEKMKVKSVGSQTDKENKLMRNVSLGIQTDISEVKIQPEKTALNTDRVRSFSGLPDPKEIPIPLPTPINLPNLSHVSTLFPRIENPLGFQEVINLDSDSEIPLNYEVTSPQPSEPDHHDKSKIDDVITNIRNQTQDFDNIEHAYLQIDTINEQLQKAEDTYNKQKKMLTSYQDSNRRHKDQNKQLKADLKNLEYRFKKHRNLLDLSEKSNERYKKENLRLKEENEKIDSLEKTVNSLRKDFEKSSKKKRVIKIVNDTTDEFDQIVETPGIKPIVKHNVKNIIKAPAYLPEILASEIPIENPPKRQKLDDFSKKIEDTDKNHDDLEKIRAPKKGRRNVSEKD